MIGVAATVLLLLSQTQSQKIGGATTVSSSAAAITITSTASATYQSTYTTASTYYGNASYPSAVTSTVVPSYCWWAPEGATSYYAQPSATVTVVPTTSCSGNVTSTIFATFSGPAATQYTSPYPGGTTTSVAATVVARNNWNGSVTSTTFSASATAQNATQYFPTIVYGNGTATAYPTTFPTSSVNGSVLICASTYGGNGSAVATAVPVGSAAPTNATVPAGNSTDAESLKSTGGENGASAHTGSGIAIALAALALLQHFMA